MLFCKYNDPPYIKSEKIDILVRIADIENADQVASSLKFSFYYLAI